MLFALCKGHGKWGMYIAIKNSLTDPLPSRA